MNLPAHLQDLFNEDGEVTVVTDNCKGHRKRTVIEPIKDYPGRDWGDTNSAEANSCRWQASKADKAPMLKSRRFPDHQQPPTALLDMMHTIPKQRQGSRTTPGPFIPLTYATQEQQNQSTGEYISSILDQLELFSDL
uniref:Uncharacterized protein n=1 Tax=Entomoneis paludosa TaxID=265537 RepID=A0A7S2YG90_9STRA|mmetsp:Transcript_31846/g.66458  ORF Transcript_31846/g.66458 Transcript_31846/m.66458 type:complete len:137 (+) Transcript_31846:78-488(+)